MNIFVIIVVIIITIVVDGITVLVLFSNFAIVPLLSQRLLNGLTRDRLNVHPHTNVKLTVYMLPSAFANE